MRYKTVERVGMVQKKILLLLLGGFAIGLSKSPRQAFRVIRLVGKEWGTLNRDSLRLSIRKLYESKLITERHNSDGSITMVLSNSGKEKAIRFRAESMKIKQPKQWDKKWRCVIFDVPEAKRKARDALRQHLQQIGFFELQRSVFIHPYPCNYEVDFLVELYEVRPYVRMMIVESIDNEKHLKKKFVLK